MTTRKDGRQGAERRCVTGAFWTRIGVLAAAWISGGLLPGMDWPQHLGPGRDGVYPGAIRTNWTGAEPALLWKASVGSGWSGPVGVSNRVYLHDRQGREERLTCWDLDTGRQAWRVAAGTAYRDDFGFDDGPRSTPAVAEDRVVTLGADGRLRCWRRTDGRLEWDVDLARDFAADKGFFGFASSPLILGQSVLVQAGGRPGAGVVALQLADGRLRWKATSDEAGYGSLVPVPDTVPGEPSVVGFNRAGLIRLALADGREMDRFPWKARLSASVNAATPWVGTEGVFVTASYGVGAAWLAWTGETWDRRWDGDDSLSAHYATPVVLDGWVYGFHGRQETGTEFRCVELRTGRVAWKTPVMPAGSVVASGGQLLLMLETGELVVADADPVRWRERGRFQVLGRGTRALPALVAGRWIARDARQIGVFDLR
jgi:outer membrane protein assembly factor BamB